MKLTQVARHGYKEVRRGKDLYSKSAKIIENRKEMLRTYLPTMIKENKHD